MRIGGLVTMADILAFSQLITSNLILKIGGGERCTLERNHELKKSFFQWLWVVDICLINSFNPLSLFVTFQKLDGAALCLRNPARNMASGSDHDEVETSRLC